METIDKAMDTTTGEDFESVEEEAVDQVAQEDTLPQGHYSITTSGTVKTGNAKGERREVTYVINLGYDMVDAQELFGDDAVRKNYVSGARVKAGGFARAQIEMGADTTTIRGFMQETWNPGYKTSGVVDPVIAGREAVGRLSDGALADLIRERGLTI